MLEKYLCKEIIAASNVASKSQRVPNYNEKYHLQNRYTKAIVECIKHRKDVLCYGPAGTGKTSGIKQIAGELGIPVVQYTCGEDTTLWDLFGSDELIQESGTTVTHFRSKAVAIACEEAKKIKGDKETKCILILDELDTCTPGLISHLNQLICEHEVEFEGRSFDASNVMIYATANTSGTGDSTGRYSGTRCINAALRDRFMPIRLGYMSQAEECDLLETCFPELKEVQGSDKSGHSIAFYMTRGAEESRAMTLEALPITTRKLLDIAPIYIDIGDLGFVIETFCGYEGDDLVSVLKGFRNTIPEETGLYKQIDEAYQRAKAEATRQQ
jgi:hypothetical protein